MTRRRRERPEAAGARVCEAGRWWKAPTRWRDGLAAARWARGGHGGGLKERGATSFDLMWRRLNFRARAHRKWLAILCNILCIINSLLA